MNFSCAQGRCATSAALRPDMISKVNSKALSNFCYYSNSWFSASTVFGRAID